MQKNTKFTTMANSSTKIITITNKKGGTGKTTSAMYIASVLRGFGVVVGIDLDPEASWYHLHKLEGKDVMGYDLYQGEIIERESDNENIESDYTARLIKKLQDLIDQVKKECKPNYIVMDTPPNSEAVSYASSMVADEVIVPLAPTVHDMDRFLTVSLTIAQVEQHRKKAISSVLLTKFKGNLNVSKEVIKFAEEYRLPLLETKIRDLVAYKENIVPAYLEEYEAVLHEIGVI